MTTNLKVASAYLTKLLILATSTGCVGSNTFSVVRSASFQEAASKKTDSELLNKNTDFNQLAESFTDLGNTNRNLSIQTDGIIQIPVNLSKVAGKDAPIKIRYELTSDQLELGEQYVILSPPVLVFNAEDKQKIILVAVKGTDAYTGNREIKVRLSSDNEIPAGKIKEHTLVIEDLKSPPQVEFAGPAIRVNEGKKDTSQTVLVKIRLSVPSLLPVRVNLSVDTGNALPGVDFTFPSLSPTIEFQPFETEKTIPLVVFGNDTFDRDRTFRLVAAGPNSNAVAITIVDDESAPTILADNSEIILREPEGGRTVIQSFQVRMSHGSRFSTTFSWAIGNDSTALNPTNYSATPGSFTIPAGQLESTLSFELHGDGIFTGDKLIRFVFNQDPKIFRMVRIKDADAPPSISFQIAAQSADEGTAVAVNLIVGGRTNLPIRVRVSPVNGSAVQGTDFTFADQVVQFDAGVGERTLSIPLPANMVFETVAKSFSLSLSQPQGGATLGISTHTVTIRNINVAPIIAFSGLLNRVAENAGSLAIPVAITNGIRSTGAIRVDLTAFGSGNIPAEVGTHFNLRSSFVTIPAGAIMTSGSVEIIDDGLYQGDRTFTVGLGSVTGASASNPSTQEITIADNEVLPEISFAANSRTVSLAEGTFRELDVELNPAPAFPTTVEFKFVNPSATLTPSDYTFAPISRILTFGPNSGRQKIKLDALVDQDLTEGTETLEVALQAPSMRRPSGATIALRVAATGSVSNIQILDIVPPPSVQFAATQTSAWEDLAEGYVDIQVTVNHAPGVGKAIEVPFTTDLATSTPSILNYISKIDPVKGVKFEHGKPTSQSIRVSIRNNDTQDPERKLVLKLGAGAGFSLVTGGKILHTLSIRDDERPANGLSLKPGMATRALGCIACHAQVENTLISDFGMNFDNNANDSFVSIVEKNGRAGWFEHRDYCFDRPDFDFRQVFGLSGTQSCSDISSRHKRERIYAGLAMDGRPEDRFNSNDSLGANSQIATLNPLLALAFDRPESANSASGRVTRRALSQFFVQEFNQKIPHNGGNEIRSRETAVDPDTGAQGEINSNHGSVKKRFEGYESIYIGAPTEKNIEDAFLTAEEVVFANSGAAKIAYLADHHSLPTLDGLEYAKRDNQNGGYFRNIAGKKVRCFGDVVVKGAPIFLENAEIETGDKGCRIYSTHTIFFRGGTKYAGVTPADTKNLQLTSARGIVMGYSGQTLRGTDAGVNHQALYEKFVSSESYIGAAQLRSYPTLRSLMFNPHNAADPATMYNDSQRVGGGGGTGDCNANPGQLHNCDSSDASYQQRRILLNAPVVFRRYKTTVEGVVITEIPFMAVGNFKFKFDAVFDPEKKVPILPLLPAGVKILEVKE